MPYTQKREREENNPLLRKGYCCYFTAMKFCISAFTILLSTWFSLVCLSVASAIKQSPNAKCLIHTSCHQEQLCLQ